MGRIHFDGNSKIKNFLKGKGFYVALAVCLVAVGGVAVATFVTTMPGLSTDGGQDNPTTLVTSPTTDRAAENIVTNIPDERTTTSASSSAKTTATPTTQSDVQPAGTNEVELFILPLSNEVLKEFSNDNPVYSQTMNDWRIHSGVDFKGNAGQEVKALANGTILSIKEDPIWGHVIEIDHGFGIQSRYYGVTAVTSLKTGDSVKVNDVIGSLSDIPCESLDGSHLHLELTADGKLIDPVEAIGREVRRSDAAAS
ncbi:MAG: M23 family metallopeptidase [Clostridiales bacterium]|nr:M23 family metallopeptidase [Clostridiales bacterium]